MDVDEAADQLYGLAPADFTAARDGLAAAARRSGDRVLAESIKALRKPSVAAWLLNLLARRAGRELEAFVALGESLREATASMSGPELRELSAQRHQVVQALVVQARTMGRERGARVGEETLRGVEETLTAALSDPIAGRHLLAGRLVATSRPSGFGAGVSVEPAPRARAGGSRTSSASPPADSAAEAKAAAAWAAAREAAELRDRLAAEEDEAGTAAGLARRTEEEARTEVSRLREQLDAAEARHGDAETARAAAEATLREVSARREAAAGAAVKARNAVSDPRHAR